MTIKPPIIVNESSSLEICGDISVFTTVEAAESYFEPWYVDESYFAFDGDGHRLLMESIGHRVRFRLLERELANPDIARVYLKARLQSIGNAKGWNKLGVSETWLETASLRELCEKNAEFDDS